MDLLGGQPELSHCAGQVEASRSVAIEIPSPQIRALGGVRDGRVADERDIACPGRVPAASADQHHHRRHFGKGSHRRQSSGDQDLHRPSHHRASGQTDLAGGQRRHHRQVVLGPQPLEVQRKRPASNLVEGARGQARARRPGSLPDVGEAGGRLGAPHPADQWCGLPGYRLFADVRESGGDGIRCIASQQVGRNPIRHAQGAGQQRPLGFFDQDQVLIDQRRTRRQPASHIGTTRGNAAQFDPKADAGATARHVILQEAVQPLETRVDIRGHGDQQQLDVDFLEPEAAAEAPQAEIGALLLRRIRCRLDVLARPGCSRVGRRRHRLRCQQAIHMRLRNVETTKTIVGFRIGGAPPRHGSADAGLDQLETAKHMDQRRIGGLILTPTATLLRTRGRGAHISGHWAMSGSRRGFAGCGRVASLYRIGPSLPDRPGCRPCRRARPA